MTKEEFESYQIKIGDKIDVIRNMENSRSLGFAVFGAIKDLSDKQICIMTSDSDALLLFKIRLINLIVKDEETKSVKIYL